MTFGAWKKSHDGTPLGKEDKDAQQALTDLRVAFFAGQRPDALVCSRGFFFVRLAHAYTHPHTKIIILTV